MAVIPNGLNLADFPPAPSPVHGRPFTVAFLGRLTQEKGVPILLGAVESMKDGSNIQWLVAGDGPFRANVEAATQQADSRLHYLGFRENVLPLYHSSDLVVMPSLSEGHPMTALEAMACGLPVVASRVGGLPEIVIDGETGVLVPPDDVGALTGALRALASDPRAARTMGAAGRRRVETEFTLERMLARVVAVYQSAFE
jgi:glycosyltransferase involved in cell wall biosynthesis